MPTTTPPSLWQQATASRGGRWATGIAIGLIAVLLLVTAVVLVRVARGDLRHDVRDRGKASFQQHAPKGQQKQAPRGQAPRDPGPGRAPQGQAPAPQGPRAGQPATPGGLPSELSRGLLHAEVTRTGPNGTPTVVLVQSGAVTAATAQSVTVKSSDDYTETYAVSGATRMPGGGTAAELAVGSQVTVMAQKDGRTALLIARTGSSS